MQKSMSCRSKSFLEKKPPDRGVNKISRSKLPTKRKLVWNWLCLDHKNIFKKQKWAASARNGSCCFLKIFTWMYICQIIVWVWRFNGKNPLAGTGIWTVDLPTRVFCQGITFLTGIGFTPIDHFAITLGDLAEVTRTPTEVQVHLLMDHLLITSDLHFQTRRKLS